MSDVPSESENKKFNLIHTKTQVGSSVDLEEIILNLYDKHGLSDEQTRIHLNRIEKRQILTAGFMDSNRGIYILLIGSPLRKFTWEIEEKLYKVTNS